MILTFATVVLQGRAVQDTVLMRVVATDPSLFQRLLGVAEIGAVLLAYVLLGAAVYGAIKLHGSFEKVREALAEVSHDVKGLADNANRISQSVSSVVDSVKADIEAVHGTVDMVNDRARQSVARLADRIDEFTNTVAIVQEDTQAAVFSAIAAFKGVRAAVSAVRKKPRPRLRKRATVAR